MVFSAAALMAFVTGVRLLEHAGWAAIAFAVAKLLLSVFYILNVLLALAHVWGGFFFQRYFICFSLMAVNG